MRSEKVKYLGDYIGGGFVLPDRADAEWTQLSPADLKDAVIEVEASLSHVEQACLAAKQAFPGWAQASLSQRTETLLNLKAAFVAHEKEMAETIARETGKPLWEAKTEAQALAAKIDVTINHSIKLVADETVPNALPGITGMIRYKPRGAMAVIGPFNFPAHLPNGHIIPALLTGNTVVFKPSDRTPATGQLMAQLIHQAGFPPGVFNLVQGRAEAGRRLVMNENIDGILFTGSYEVGLKIKQDTLAHYWKIHALEMGGKNCSVVWEDADLEKAIYENIIGAFLSSGQRCSCTSKILIHRKVFDQFVTQFHATAKKLSVGHWRDNPFMGPLIDAHAVEKYIRFQEMAKREGGESLMRGKPLNLDHEGYYVTPSISVFQSYDPQSVYQKSEIFGPNVAILPIDDFDEAMNINNASGFGLALSIFSAQRSLYERATLAARVGLVNWNRTTNGASSRLPFGGMGKSGNDRPSAHFAVYYCTVPVSSLEDTTPFDPQKVVPGVQYPVKGE